MEYDQAKSILDKHGAVDVDGVESQEVDPNMYFKALIGRDRKGIMEIGCGFDMTQLKTLFPEEMREFQRWKTVSSSLLFVLCYSVYIKFYACFVLLP